MKIIDNAELGNKIRVLRENKKETQDDLKKVLNFNNRQQVSYIERGDRLPTLEQIGILAQHYNVTTDYLLGLSAVATNDTDLKAVCSYTGLSENIIKFLSENKDPSYSEYSGVIEFLECFINEINHYSPYTVIEFIDLKELTTIYINDLCEEIEEVKKLQCEFINEQTIYGDMDDCEVHVTESKTRINGLKYILNKIVSEILDKYSISGVDCTLNDVEQREKHFHIEFNKLKEMYESNEQE